MPLIVVVVVFIRIGADGVVIVGASGLAIVNVVLPVAGLLILPAVS